MRSVTFLHEMGDGVLVEGEDSLHGVHELESDGSQEWIILPCFQGQQVSQLIDAELTKMESKKKKSLESCKERD